MKRFFAAVVAFGLPIAVSVAAEVGGVSATAKLPNSPGVIVSQVFNFALMFSGLLAFVMIVWGGVKYAANPGNPSALDDAKDRIIQALFGLLLLLGSFLVLRTINPQIQLSAFRPLTTVTTIGAFPSCSPPCEAGSFCSPSGSSDPTALGVCKSCPVACDASHGQVCRLMPGFDAPMCVTCDPSTLAECQSQNKQCVATNSGGFLCIGACLDGFEHGYCDDPNEVCITSEGKTDCVPNPI